MTRPEIVTADQWQAALAELLVEEEAHTRAGDALAARRRRLPMTPVPAASVIGAAGELPLLDVFEGRSMLIGYHFMWHHGEPLHAQCGGCTFSISQVGPGWQAYLAERDITFAVLCAGSWPEISVYREFMGWTMPWYSTADAPQIAGDGQLRCYLREGDQVYLTYETDHRGTEVLDPVLGLLDRTVYGRQEPWEDSPPGWPQHPMGWWRRDGRPVAQWLRTTEPATSGHCCQH